MVNFGVGVPTEGFPFLVLLFFLLLPLSFSASLFIIFSHVEAIGPVCAIFLNFAELACNSILVFRVPLFKHKSSWQRERERAVDRKTFALAFASPINLKRLRTGWQLRHSVRQQMLVPKTPKENSSLFTSLCKPLSLAMTNFVPTKMLTPTGMMVMSTVGVGEHNDSEFARKKLSECLTLVTGRLSNNPLARSPG